MPAYWFEHFEMFICKLNICHLNTVVHSLELNVIIEADDLPSATSLTIDLSNKTYQPFASPTSSRLPQHLNLKKIRRVSLSVTSEEFLASRSADFFKKNINEWTQQRGEGFRV